MPTALSFDLRVRVLAAVAKGLNHRAAAERFGVSAASVSRWRRLAQEQGEKARARSMGGDRRSGRIEVHKDMILTVLATTPDIAIEELRQDAGRQGAGRRVWHDPPLLRAARHHAKKRPRMRASRTDPMSWRASTGLVRWPARSRSRAACLHRRNMGLHQHGPSLRPLPARRTPPGRRTPRPLEDHDLRRRADHARHDCAPSYPMARSIGPPLRPMSRKCSSQNSRPATSWSWTISPATKGRTCAR